MGKIESKLHIITHNLATIMELAKIGTQGTAQSEYQLELILNGYNEIISELDFLKKDFESYFTQNIELYKLVIKLTKERLQILEEKKKEEEWNI